MPLPALLLSSGLLFFPSSQQAQNAEHPVESLDRALNAALLRKDAAAARPYYAEGFLLTTGAGRTKTADDLIAEVQRPDVSLDINETSQVRVRTHGDTAVLTAVLHQKGKIGDQAFDVKLLVTDTWVRAGATWRLFAGHASRIP
jgi:ketosteroid isomerase-like protein